MRTLLLLLLGGAAASVAPAQTYDLIIRGGRLLDGTGAPWRYADVAVRGDRIVAVGRLPESATAPIVLDARGKYVAPGYIDPHTHAIDALVKREEAGARALVAQGVTTAFINHDGAGPAELPPQLRTITAAGPGINVAPLVGHTSIRLAAMGQDNRAPTAAELEHMQALVQAAMQAGAFGLSSGPFYAPGSYAKTDELVALARVAGRLGGVYTSHIRDDSDYTIGVVAAVEEVITIARAARLPGIVSHIKTAGPRVRGFSGEIIRRIDAARRDGVEVWADQYPYDASQTRLMSYVIPNWAQEGGIGAMMARLADPATLARVREGILENLARRGGAGTLQVAEYEPDVSLQGKRLDAIAHQRGVHPADLAIDLIKASQGQVRTVSFTVFDEDIEAFMRQPWTMTGSDGAVPVFGVGAVHPRGYGTFPRKIRTYVLEKKLLSLEQAVHVGTGLTAAVFGVHDRGVVRPGAYADLHVFTLEVVRDTATYEKPHAFAEGVNHVLLNGQLAIRDSRFLDRRVGRILARNQP